MGAEREMALKTGIEISIFHSRHSAPSNIAGPALLQVPTEFVTPGLLPSVAASLLPISSVSAPISTKSSKLTLRKGPIGLQAERELAVAV